MAGARDGGREGVPTLSTLPLFGCISSVFTSLPSLSSLFYTFWCISARHVHACVNIRSGVRGLST